MLDSKPILAQVHELQILVNKLKPAKIDISEAFQVGAIIGKLPSSQKNYRKKLLQNSDDLSLEQILKHPLIGEKQKDRKKSEADGYSKVNEVNTKAKKKHDGKKNYLGLKKEQNNLMNYGGSKGTKVDVMCACDKHDHYDRDCRYNKSKNEANIVQANDNIIFIVTEIMMIKDNVQG